jgi:hypothetical protein
MMTCRLLLPLFALGTWALLPAPARASSASVTRATSSSSRARSFPGTRWGFRGWQPVELERPPSAPTLEAGENTSNKPMLVFSSQ